MADDSENEARRQSEWFTSMARGLGSEVNGARLQAVLHKLHAGKPAVPPVVQLVVPANTPEEVAPRDPAS